MITLELGELYGMANQKELTNTIKELKDMGMSDDDIQKILDRSKKGDTEPVFEDIDGKIYIKENAIIIDPNI